jgi:sulfate adenylyltransferase subunit 2
MSMKDLENRSIYIIREAYAEFENPAVLWSTGKDSTAVLWLCRKAFFGKIPFPVIHIDTGYKFKQMYEFRDRIAEAWGFDLVVAKNEEALSAGLGPENGKLECCTDLKTKALMKYLDERGFDALLLAIRRDEHGIRAKERVFSPRDEEFRWNYRDQPLEMWDQYQAPSQNQDVTSNKAHNHTRVHPILHWRELDVWEFVKQEKDMPVNPMYFANNGKRYRSLGCEPCTSPIDSDAATIDEIVEELRTTKIAERSGRAQDKEKAFMMQKLRALGYM